jgi:putative DNA primase/helicase
LLFQVVRVPATAKRAKFFFQRQPDGQGSWQRKLDPKSGKMKLTMEGARLVPYHLDRLVAAKQQANGHPPKVFICEGEKDADRLAEGGFLTSTNPGGAGKWRADYNQYFAGFEIVILPDNDKTGRDHAQHVATALAPVAHSVRIVSFEGLPEKGDVSDWIERGGTPDALTALVEQTPLWVGPPPDLRPQITVVSGERHLAADEGIAALVAAKAPFYQRNKKIVRVASVKAKNSTGEIILVPGIVEVDKPIMERNLAHSATWVKFDGRKKENVSIDPPAQVATQILSMAGEWPFEPLRGIIQCPTLRRDGTLLDKEGYDKTTGLVLTNTVKMPALNPSPTKNDATAALKTLTDLLAEFPFVDDEGRSEPVNNASRSVALSMLITPVVRGAMDVAPMHLITKPLPGTGSSYLVDCAAMIATGEVCAVESMAPKYEETEKRLVGAALSGFPIIGIDNVREIVAGDFFCQVVERPLMSLRALSSSEKHRIPNTFTVFANGVNATVAEDMVRRTLRGALDADLEHPEERKFKSDPLAAIGRSRGDYVAACLTIVRAYVVAGRPIKTAPLASFGGWSRFVREPLVWLGCADPVASQKKLREGDPRKAEMTEVFKAWKSAIGVGKNLAEFTKDIIAKALGDTTSPLFEALWTVAAQRYSEPLRKIDAKALGKWLASREGQIASNCKLLADRTDASRPRWYLNLSNVG